MRRIFIGRILIATAVAVGIAVALGTHGAASAAAAGNSRTGCMDQWLFNGVWRAEVTKIAPHMDGATQTGWEVTEVWRNGSQQELAPIDSVIQDEKLELSNGQILASDTTTGTLSFQSVAYHDFAPAAELTYTQLFIAPNLDPSDKPKAVDVMFDANKLAMLSRPQFTTKQYDFHFDLGCTATGAAAQAQGGANQIDAIPGCRNQWLSNGIWKMRVTDVSPDDGDPGSTTQIGWFVGEQWTALAPKAPADTYVGDQFLITTSGQNVASSNSVVTTLASQKLDYHTFAVGETFTYTQNFRWAPFDPTDKPVRLLITFDAVSQNKRDGQPHFKLPANFRIDLTCTK